MTIHNYKIVIIIATLVMALLTMAGKANAWCPAGQTCGTYQGGTCVDYCRAIEVGYPGSGRGWYCGNGGVSACTRDCTETPTSCSATFPGAIGSCESSGSPLPTSCTCSALGGSCSGKNEGDLCGPVGSPYSGSCGNCTGSPVVCNGSVGSSTVGCCMADGSPSPTIGSPTVPPVYLTPIEPTNTPTPIPTNTPTPTRTPTPTNTPTPTPTPVIVGNIYYDNDDGTIQVVGSMCARIGLQPTPQVVPGANVSAIKASSGVISPGTILGATFTIVSNLVKGATDYRVQLALPTPAPGQAVAYTCGCPVTAGQEYLCEYTGVAADSTVNFFVKENNLADPWWQTVGGNIFAKYQVRSKVPVSTCDADPNCDSGVITGPTNANFSGFIAVGETGSVSTTKDNSTAYVNAANTRTSSQGAFAVGAQQMVENYDTFYGNVSRQLVSVTSLNDLVTKIAAQATNTTGLYLYTSGDLTINKSGAPVPLAIPADKRVVVFVPGNLQITNSSALDAPRIITVANGGFLMFIVRSNITIAAEVGHISNTVIPTTSNPNIEGVYFANGQITVASDGSATTSDRKLIAAGTFVGLDTANVGNGINLLRNFDDGGLGKTKNSVAPTEVFMFRPDFVDNYPVELKTASYNWKELAPQR